MSINNGMNKKNMVHLYKEILLRHFRNEMTFTSEWIELEKKLILSEVIQTQKDKYTYSLIWGY